MIPLSLSQIAKIVEADNVEGLPDLTIQAVSIDSRDQITAKLFIAIKGERFDAHEFVNQAIASGAIALITERKLDVPVPQLIVKNSKIALGQIAHFIRKQSTAKVVALTGSSGKTSVKEMTASILSQCGNTLATQGNLNNDIGVPLTLLRLTPEYEFAVVELGANHIGEIAYTTHLTRPQSALINNLAAAHLEGFGSLEGVAKAKGEIFQGLPQNGYAIINQDSHAFSMWQPMLEDKNVWRFGLTQTEDKSTDFYASNIELTHEGTVFQLHTPNGITKIQFPLLGKHNVTNAVAAAALAMSVGANLTAIKNGLCDISPNKGRLYPIKLTTGCVILDDTYNANLISMMAAIDVLALMPKYRVMVMGDMAELGSNASDYHQQIGEHVAQTDIDELLTVGVLSEFASKVTDKGKHFQNKDQLVAYLADLVKQHQTMTVLMKGSRSSAMDEVIMQLKEHVKG